MTDKLITKLFDKNKKLKDLIIPVNIYRFRKSLKLTRKEFAEPLNVTGPVIANYEYNVTKVPADFLLELSIAYRIPLLFWYCHSKENYKIIKELTNVNEDKIINSFLKDQNPTYN